MLGGTLILLPFSTVPSAAGITFKTLIDEGGAVNFLARQGATEVEVIANVSRVGNTIKLEGLHFTKNAGETLSMRQLHELAREFGRQQCAKEVIIQGAVRTTGRTAGKIYKPITVKVPD
jgi:hypothetical protein